MDANKIEVEVLSTQQELNEWLDKIDPQEEDALEAQAEAHFQTQELPEDFTF